MLMVVSILQVVLIKVLPSYESIVIVSAVIVLDALMNPLPVEISQKNSSSNPLSQPLSAIPTSDSPAVGTPRRALDMLAWTLKDPDVPPEVRANIATLVGHLGRQGVVDSSRARDVQVLKEEVKGVLEKIVKAQRKSEEAVVEDEDETEEKVTEALGSAAKRALDALSA